MTYAKKPDLSKSLKDFFFHAVKTMYYSKRRPEKSCAARVSLYRAAV